MDDKNTYAEKIINNEPDHVRNHRIDVIKFYKFVSNEKLKCGWNFNLKDTKIKDVKVEMFFENKWNIIFTLKNSFSDFDIDNFSCKKLIKYVPSFVVVDNFYDNVDSIRKFALSLNFSYHANYHKGKRTDEVYRFNGLKENFESILNCKIKNWTNYRVNGCFQYCIGGDQLVYHHDTQEYAGIIFLTPDAPQQTGTTFYRSKHTKQMKIKNNNEPKVVFKNGFLDPTEFEVVDVVGNVYNRLVLFDSQMFHAASNYFGNTLNNGRLFQLFFFDLEI